VAAEFVALADLLRAPAATAADGDAAAQTSGSIPSNAARCEERGRALESSDITALAKVAAPDIDEAFRASLHAALRDARLFRARLADAFDDAAARLLRDLAADVLARELRLAPCELTAIVQRIAECAPVVRVRTAACDAARTAGVLRSRGCDVVVVEDAALAGGDAVVELAGGALDARLGVRLAAALEAFA
jgi:hypothetical protein